MVRLGFYAVLVLRKYKLIIAYLPLREFRTQASSNISAWSASISNEVDAVILFGKRYRKTELSGGGS